MNAPEPLPAPVRVQPDPRHDRLIDAIETTDSESAEAALRGVLELAREHELGALRLEFPMPWWVGLVRNEIERAFAEGAAEDDQHA